MEQQNPEGKNILLNDVFDWNILNSTREESFQHGCLWERSLEAEVFMKQKTH